MRLAGQTIAAYAGAVAGGTRLSGAPRIEAWRSSGLQIGLPDASAVRRVNVVRIVGAKVMAVGNPVVVAVGIGEPATADAALRLVRIGRAFVDAIRSAIVVGIHREGTL